ncbi:hypothetical protein SXAG_00129 [Synechococcus phage S-CBS4]|nr:hypothetical protein SXAG_00129 [Synechococcus phage S-CBS4]
MNDIEMDAMRYRWLRETQNAEFRDLMVVQGAIDTITVCDEAGDYGSAYSLAPHELDDAIDAAMERWPL